MSSLLGLNIALRGLLAHQAALETTGHNVANASTEGYSRQSAPLSATDPINMAGLSARPGRGVIGTGVSAAIVQRTREAFLDLQYRDATEKFGFFETVRDTMRHIEAIFGEPSTSAISGLMENLFATLQDLSNTPEDVAARTAVVEAGRSFSFMIRRTYDEIVGIQRDLDTKVSGTVIELNDLATQVANLNLQIVRGSAGGTPANDLMDRRDVILDRMSKLTGIEITINDNGAADVRMNGMLLVAGEKTYTISTVVNVVTGFFDVQYDPFSQILSPTQGELGGLMDARDSKIGSVAAGTGILDRINDFASNFITEFNKLHRGGFGIVPFGDDNVEDVTTELGDSGVYTIASDGAGNLSVTFTPDSTGVPTTAVTGTIAAGGTNNSLIPGILLTAAAVFSGAADTTTITISDGLVVAAGANADVTAADNVTGTFKLVTNVGAGTVDITFTPVGGVAGATVTKAFVAGAANSDLITGLTIDFKQAADLIAGGVDYISTGNDFFTGVAQTGGVAARDINVSSSLTLGFNSVAASSRFREEGNGLNALSLSAMGDVSLTALSDANLSEFHRSTIGALGAGTRQAANGADNQDDLISLVGAAKESISGVNIDEETVDLLRFELAFQGAARVMTTIDELLDMVVNRLGIGGR